jgi:ferredoxin-NADP reductase
MRGGSVYVLDELKDGQVIHIRPPRNHFPLTKAPRLLLLAGASA